MIVSLRLDFHNVLKIFMLLLLSANTVYAQAVNGSVSQKDGQGIGGVYITILNTNLGTISDKEGKFNLEKIPAGSTMRISAIGYTTQELPVNDSVVKVVLDPAIIYLNNNIIITAQRYEAKQIDVSESVTVLTSSDLLQQAPRSTPEALFGSTGVWVQKTNHGGGSPIIRGFVGNQVLLMMDGIRLNNATYRYGPNQYLSTIDPGLIDRIEVTRGNGSVLYGSDALGGVVHILSKTPFFSQDKKFRGNVYGKWQSENMEKSGRSELQVNSNQLAALVGFSARDFGDIVAGDTLGTLSPTGYHEFSGDAKIIIRSGERTLFTGAYQHLTQHDVPRYDQVVQGGFKTFNFDPQTRQLGYVRWETFSDNNFFQSVRITGSWNRSTEGVVSQKNGSNSIKNQLDVVDTRGFVAEVTSQWKPNWQSQTGFEYYHDRVKSEAHVTDVASEITTEQRGSFADGATSSNLAFFSNHVADWKKFQLTTGVRFNTVKLNVQDTTFGDQQIKPSALVGNIGLSYKFHPNHHFIVSANSGFRAPNIDDVSKFGAVESTVFEIPSANLSPERSFSFETGLKSSTGKFSGTLSVYKTFLFDQIDRMAVTYQGQDTIENRRVYKKQNVGESELYGLEADMEFNVSASWVAFGNLTYTYGQNISKDEPMRRIPPLFGKIGLRYQRGSTWWAKTEWLLAGSQDRLAGGDLSDGRIAIRLVDGVMPGWNIVNLYAGIKIKFVSLTASAQNIFDAAYRVYGSGVDGYGRTFWISTTVQF